MLLYVLLGVAYAVFFPYLYCSQLSPLLFKNNLKSFQAILVSIGLKENIDKEIMYYLLYNLERIQSRHPHTFILINYTCRLSILYLKHLKLEIFVILAYLHIHAVVSWGWSPNRRIKFICVSYTTYIHSLEVILCIIHTFVHKT